MVTVPLDTQGVSHRMTGRVATRRRLGSSFPALGASALINPRVAFGTWGSLAVYLSGCLLQRLGVSSLSVEDSQTDLPGRGPPWQRREKTQGSPYLGRATEELCGPCVVHTLPHVHTQSPCHRLYDTHTHIHMCTHRVHVTDCMTHTHTSTCAHTESMSQTV